jgi:hypothetical protein
MAKKASLVGRKSLESKSISQGSTESRPTKISLARRTGEGRGEGDRGRLQRPLLDTRVVYCGDNLEKPGRMQRDEGRMMKPAHPLFLHSSFILLTSPVTASHYVKVRLDQ